MSNVLIVDHTIAVYFLTLFSAFMRANIIATVRKWKNLSGFENLNLNCKKSLDNILFYSSKL